MAIYFDDRNPKHRDGKSRNAVFQTIESSELQELERKILKQKEDRVRLLLQKYPQFKKAEIL